MNLNLKKILALALVSCVWMTQASADEAAKKTAPMNTVAVVGQTAPGFSRPDMNGKTVELSKSLGKVIVLEWFNHGCPFVKKHYSSGNMQGLQKKYTAKGVVWFSIVSSACDKEGHETPAEALAAYKEHKSVATDVLIDEDGSVGKLYGAKTTPHMIVIDRKGRVAYSGAIDDHPSTDAEDIATSKNYVSAALDEIMADKPVSVSSTKGYGCSVKY